MKRRTFLTGGAIAATGLSLAPEFALETAHAADRPLTITEVEGAAAKLRARFAQGLVSVYRGERSMLPMIDVSLTRCTWRWQNRPRSAGLMRARAE